VPGSRSSTGLMASPPGPGDPCGTAEACGNGRCSPALPRVARSQGGRVRPAWFFPLILSRADCVTPRGLCTVFIYSDSSNEPNRWLSQRGRSVLLGEPPAVVPLGLWKREKRGRPCLRRATEPPREAQFLETTALVPVLPSALARLSRLLRAVTVLPPVTFALPSSRVTPEVPVGPATPTRWPSSAGCECLLHICISHWTSSARAPWCHQGKPNAVASPKEESSSWSGSSQ